MAIGLLEFANSQNRYFPSRDRLVCPRGFYAPGFWVAIAAKARDRRIIKDNIEIQADDVASYASAMGLESVIWGHDTYQYTRVKQGATYSPLVLLDHVESVDIATSTINSCIRSIVSNPDAGGVRDLCYVVGELHDNVWSHGQATGISMAQVYSYNQYGRIIEFALADCGKGFLREMRDSGLTIGSHREAIDWCIQEGNSTKHADSEDEWAQHLPFDAIHNPYGHHVTTSSSDNHHQGLGLHKLIKLVLAYRGKLQLLTGNCMLLIDNNGKVSYSENIQYWCGVAISCSFSEQNLDRQVTTPSEATRELMDQLREDSA